MYQWHYPSINLPFAWDVTRGSDNVIVAIIDTGVLLSHPDLSGQLIHGRWAYSAHDIRWGHRLVDIVERAPAAVWQDNHQLTLIDKDGVALEPVKADAMPDLPLVIGPGNHRRCFDLRMRRYRRANHVS